jgi:hypothetical protein
MGHRRKKCHMLNGRAATKVARRQTHGPGYEAIRSGRLPDVPYCKFLFLVPHDFPAQKFLLGGRPMWRAALPRRMAKGERQSVSDSSPGITGTRPSYVLQYSIQYLPYRVDLAPRWWKGKEN